jgi:hypothetical protein
LNTGWGPTKICEEQPPGDLCQLGGHFGASSDFGLVAGVLGGCLHDCLDCSANEHHALTIRWKPSNIAPTATASLLLSPPRGFCTLGSIAREVFMRPPNQVDFYTCDHHGGVGSCCDALCSPVPRLGHRGGLWKDQPDLHFASPGTFAAPSRLPAIVKPERLCSCASSDCCGFWVSLLYHTTPCPQPPLSLISLGQSFHVLFFLQSFGSVWSVALGVLGLITATCVCGNQGPGSTLQPLERIHVDSVLELYRSHTVSRASTTRLPWPR